MPLSLVRPSVACVASVRLVVGLPCPIAVPLLARSTLIALGGFSAADWDTERQSYGHDAVAVECAGCGDRFYTDDPSDDAYCAACAMPAAELAALRMVPAPTPVACLFCGDPIYRGDADDAGTRHPRCGRFLAGLDARRAAWKEEPIAA